MGSQARRNLTVSQSFGDDALGYFTERLDPKPTRAALAAVLHRAKRNKAFENCRFVGLALDGTTGGRRRKWGCPLCRPYRNADREILGYRHHLVMAAVVGGDLTLPVDVEPYGPGDSEYRAGQRLLRRVRVNLGARFIDYVVVDGGFATAPFLHAAGDVGWPVVARLKDNLPELSQAAERRFRSRPPDLEFRDGTDRVQLWDADDFGGGGGGGGLTNFSSRRGERREGKKEGREEARRRRKNEEGRRARERRRDAGRAKHEGGEGRKETAEGCVGVEGGVEAKKRKIGREGCRGKEKGKEA